MSENLPEPDVTEILMQDRRAPVFKGGHVHTCPECSEHVPCEDACGCFEDMRLEDGTERGGFVVCDVCTERAKSAPSRDVIDLMEALRASLTGKRRP